MKTIIKLVALLSIVFSFSTPAKSLIKRVDPEVLDLDKDVAMALETFDGEFFDMAEFNEIRKFRGNAGEILKKDTVILLKSGEEIGVNAIRYFFIEKKMERSMPKTTGKSPNDEE